MCGAGCGHDGKPCPYKTVSIDAVKEGKATITVNGKSVDHVVPYQDCFLLAKKSGDLQWTADKDGKFKIGIDVTVEDRYMRIGSVIVW